MKKIIFSAAVAAVALLSAIGLHAQNFQTAYFLDNYTYSYQLSPASMPKYNKGFFGIGIDNISVSANSNLGLSSVFFPVTVEGKTKLVTGLNDLVSAEQFLGGLKERNGAVVGASINVLSFGFRGKNDSFHTFEINARVNVAASVPKSFISLMKLGCTVPGTYTGSNISLNTTDYIEIVSGHSYRLNDNIRLGGKVKLLAGVGDASVKIDSFQATANETVDLHAEGSGSVFALAQEIKADADGNIDLDFDIVKPRPGGYGVALDFGVEMKFPGVEGLSMTAAIMDLGGLVWLNGTTAHAGLNGKVGEDIQGINLDEILKVDQVGVNKFRMLSPTVNAGVKYDVARMLSVGALATARFGRYPTYEARLGASFNPGRVLSIAASAGVNNFGAGFGAALSFNVPGFNLFIGTDSIVTQFTPEYIPVNRINTRLNLGLAIAF